MIDSSSSGDPSRFLSLDLLLGRLRALRPAPESVGRVVLIVRRVEGGRRESLDRAAMTPGSGVPGDAWGRGPSPALEAQLSAMQAEVARLIANGQPLILSGDNLFLDLDLSLGNLPPGSRLRAGGVTLEVTPKPHNGCRKFRARFGDEALGLVSRPDLRHLNLRGIYLRVIDGGEMSVGDPVEVVRRGAAPAHPS